MSYDYNTHNDDEYKKSMAKLPFPFGNCSETANQLDSRCDDGNQQSMAKQPFPVLAQRLHFHNETQNITKNGQRTNKLINELLDNESFFYQVSFHILLQILLQGTFTTWNIDSFVEEWIMYNGRRINKFTNNLLQKEIFIIE